MRAPQTTTTVTTRDPIAVTSAIIGENDPLFHTLADWVQKDFSGAPMVEAGVNKPWKKTNIQLNDVGTVTEFKRCYSYKEAGDTPATAGASFFAGCGQTTACPYPGRPWKRGDKVFYQGKIQTVTYWEDRCSVYENGCFNSMQVTDANNQISYNLYQSDAKCPHDPTPRETLVVVKTKKVTKPACASEGYGTYTMSGWPVAYATGTRKVVGADAIPGRRFTLGDRVGYAGHATSTDSGRSAGTIVVDNEGHDDSFGDGRGQPYKVCRGTLDGGAPFSWVTAAASCTDLSIAMFEPGTLAARVKHRRTQFVDVADGHYGYSEVGCDPAADHEYGEGHVFGGVAASMWRKSTFSALRHMDPSNPKRYTISGTEDGLSSRPSSSPDDYGFLFCISCAGADTGAAPFQLKNKRLLEPAGTNSDVRMGYVSHWGPLSGPSFGGNHALTLFRDAFNYEAQAYSQTGPGCIPPDMPGSSWRYPKCGEHPYVGKEKTVVSHSAGVFENTYLGEYVGSNPGYYFAPGILPERRESAYDVHQNEGPQPSLGLDYECPLGDISDDNMKIMSKLDPTVDVTQKCREYLAGSHMFLIEDVEVFEILCDGKACADIYCAKETGADYCYVYGDPV